jgi:lipopolysaccharide/colanic/teichoic acid biosynthesis glycosyltransferase
VPDQIVSSPTVGAASLAPQPAFPVWKRCLDVALGVPLLACSGPILAAAFVANRITGDSGPLFYSAVRMGEGGRLFRALKLRTMRADSAGSAVTGVSDVRITRVGRLLRKTKFDELPQLWNVVRGEMSLVGPRPEDPRYADWSNPLHRTVFSARPGVTGPAQIAFRHEESLLASSDIERTYIEEILPAKLALDAAYLAHRSLSSDLGLLGRTVLAVAR